MKKSATELLRELPGVDGLLRSPALSALSPGYPHSVLVGAARVALERLREEILKNRPAGQDEHGDGPVTDVDEIARTVALEVEEFYRAGLRRVINGTGTILHTNLGRAVLAEEAAEAASAAALNYVDLELDLKTGARSERDLVAEALVCALTGAEAACIVNNNAAAVLLALNTLAEGKEVVVSRGELIEIGGSFRLPDIIEKSGCILKEVGTTNRTHVADYRDAMSERTALFFKAHKSNYKVVGFTAEVGLKELCAVAARCGTKVVEDLGAGALVDMTRYGLAHEPVVAECLSAGADIVTFSGDKLVGGPQSGIIAGKLDLVDKIRRNPLKRALRCDKMTMAALESTLKLYLKTDELCNSLPVLRAMTRPLEEITANARKAASLLKGRLGPGFTVEVVEVGAGTALGSVAGGGSLPGYTLPTAVLKVTHAGHSVNRIYAGFLGSTPPILGRINNGCFLLDMRTVNRPEDVLPDTFTDTFN